jgi:hypothetical protein
MLHCGKRVQRRGRCEAKENDTSGKQEKQQELGKDNRVRGRSRPIVDQL